MTAGSDILGVILAGGAGRRMFADAGGTGDKCLIELGGKAMLAHVIERLAPQVGQIVLNANGDPSRLRAFDLAIVPDPDDSRAGPLAGYAAAMMWAEKQPRPQHAIVTVPCDSPFLPVDLVLRLSEAARDGNPAIAVSAGRRHPVVGFWPLAIRPNVEKALREGRRRVEDFAQHQQAIEVVFPFGDIGGVSVDPFFNANSPEDVATARRLLSGQP
ncbi:MAG: molybdenum cofactor guanylyltransferase MobA [Hyphomicrobium sp.]